MPASWKAAISSTPSRCRPAPTRRTRSPSRRPTAARPRPAGVLSFTVRIPTSLDDVEEANETVSLTVGGVSATGTIIDDDTSTIQTVGDATVTEAGGLVHVVALTKEADSPHTYSFSL